MAECQWSNTGKLKKRRAKRMFKIRFARGAIVIALVTKAGSIVIVIRPP